MHRVELKRKIAEYRVDNDVFDDEVLQGLSGNGATVSPAQIEIVKATIMAQMEIEKARIKQEIRISELSNYNTASSGLWKTKIWSNQTGTVSP